jgi:ribosomal protein S18 acetylase RimI-like enzyme
MSGFIRIEKMAPGDIGAAYALYLDNSDDDTERYVIDWLNETVGDPYGYFFAAYVGDELAGWCGMYHNTPISNPDITTPDYCKIGNIVVKKDYRRKGIGKSLVMKMLDTAKELGVYRTKLEVDTISDAVRLYESLGFKIEETVEMFYDDGSDAYIMWRYDN